MPKVSKKGTVVKSGDGGAADAPPGEGSVKVSGGAVQKPAEEIIQLRDGLHKRAFDGKGKGKGRGKGKGTGEPSLLPQRLGAGLRKYSRITGKDARRAPGDMKLGGQLRRQDSQNREAVYRLIKGEVLQTETGGFIETERPGESTQRLSQGMILEGATLGVAKKRFDFKLPYGPYSVGFTSNGQHILAGGRKGQVALMECDTMNILTELHLKETVRAVQPLHNHLLFAVAQRKYVYIYDNQGREIHCLRDHMYTTHMDFLPYHFLLVAASEHADLQYRDISTGKEVAKLKTRLGPCRSMRQNPTNAVMHIGHSNGTVTMWTPTVKEPVVKVACHSGHVTAMAIHRDYMMTAGSEGWWKVWDLRKYEPVHVVKQYGHAVSDADFSMTGLLAVAAGARVHVWKDTFGQDRVRQPYITEELRGKMASSVRFRPYEDVLGVGHGEGFGGLIVPGAGYANFDSYEADPFETKRQRQEREIHRLLDKLQPDSIMVDPSRIGSIDKKVVKEYTDQQEKLEKEKERAEKQKKKMRGKNKVGNRMKRKKLKEGAEQRQKTKARLDGEDSNADSSSDDVTGEADGENVGEREPLSADAGGAGPKPPGVGVALGRFYGKRRRKT